MRFRTSQDAFNFGRKFATEYLIPIYGKDEIVRFPMTKVTSKVIGSPEEGSRVIGQFIGLISEDKDQEVWLLIPNDRYQEVETYLISIKG